LRARSDQFFVLLALLAVMTRQALRGNLKWEI